MALMRFIAGQEVRIGAEVHRFVDSGTDAAGRQGWILKNLGSGDARLYSRVELAALFESGALKAHHTDGEVVAAQREAARRRRVRATDDLPPGRCATPTGPGRVPAQDARGRGNLRDARDRRWW